jgi:hypothetical protein
VKPACRGHDSVSLSRPTNICCDRLEQVTVALQDLIDNVQGRQGVSLVAITAPTRQHKIGQTIDADKRPGQDVIDRISGRQVRVAIGAVRAESFKGSRTAANGMRPRPNK